MMGLAMLPVLVQSLYDIDTRAMQAAFLKMYETSLSGTRIQNMDAASGRVAAKPVH